MVCRILTRNQTCPGTPAEDSNPRRYGRQFAHAITGLHNWKSSKGQIDEHNFLAWRRSIFRLYSNLEKIQDFAKFTAIEKHPRATRNALADCILCRSVR